MRIAPVALAMPLLFGALAAADEKPPLVVLELDAKGASSLQADAATQGILRGLRQLEVFQVLSADDVRQLLALERRKQLLGAEGDSGLADLTKSLGARHAVVGSVTKVGEKLQVEVRLLDTQLSKVLSQKSVGPVPRMEDLAPLLPGMAQELVAPLLREQQGSLVVRASEGGAEVLVDDTLIGSTPRTQPIVLPRGSHRLQLRKDGFLAQTLPIRIEPNQVTVQEVTLIPSPDYVEAYEQRHGRLRIGAYVATVIAVASFGGALLIDQRYTEPTYRKEYLPRQAALKDELLPEGMRGDAEATKTWQQCGLDQESCYATVKGLESKLSIQQVATASLAGLGIAATAAATYLWLTGKDPNRYTRLVASVGPRGEPAVLVAGRF